MATCTRSNERQTLSPPGQSADGRDWQTILAESIRSPAALCRLLGLPPALADEAQRAAGDFPLLAPRPYLARIRPGDSADPLLMQILPRAAENAAVPGYQADPLGEAAAMCGPGLLRKYHGRLLMVATGSCVVHCRYCFRRHFLRRAAQKEAAGELSPVAPPHCNGGAFECVSIATDTFEAIAADPSIHEIILSGGDPLSLPDGELAELFEKLTKPRNLRRIRIHTRLPVMIPQRVTNDFVRLLQACRLPVILVVQINHPAEIDRDVANALERFVDAGVPVLNQSVLLRGVNDRADVLAELCERLVDLRVMPYYLHQLDPVAGAAHFEVPVAVGVAILSELRARLPGYAVPRYVRETPGGVSKEVLA